MSGGERGPAPRSSGVAGAPGAGASRRPGLRERIYRLRGVLLAPPLLAALAVGGDGGAGWWVLGLALFGAGAALRVWAQQHVRYRLDGASTLATTGPYRRTRNPVYLGTILACAGAVAVLGRPGLVLATAAWCAAVYGPVVRFEEDHLRRKFGEEYRRYRRRVPRWRPTRSSDPLQLVNGRLWAALRAESGLLLLLAPFLLRAALG